MNNAKTQLLEAAKQYTDSEGRVQKKKLVHLAKEYGLAYESIQEFFAPEFRSDVKGRYVLSKIEERFASASTDSTEPAEWNNAAILLTDMIPKESQTFVKWGEFNYLSKIISSGQFHPVFITGLSGNGKTLMVEQVCAKHNRKMVRIQITPETDETDLIGAFQLVNGNTVFEKGPVIKAMEEGAILLMDEIDRGNNNLMCVQNVLEGTSVLIKKINQLVEPAPGFNVIATANTKGQGDDTGKFIAASIIDEAFLERFPNTICQTYPSESIETRILSLTYGEEDDNVNKFIKTLVSWAGAIRKTYEDGGIDDVISTRRLCHIINTFKIFYGGDKKSFNSAKRTAIEKTISRFCEDTRESFMDFYQKFEVLEDQPEGVKIKNEPKKNDDDCPF